MPQVTPGLVVEAHPDGVRVTRQATEDEDPCFRAPPEKDRQWILRVGLPSGRHLYLFLLDNPRGPDEWLGLSGVTGPGGWWELESDVADALRRVLGDDESSVREAADLIRAAWELMRP